MGKILPRPPSYYTRKIATSLWLDTYTLPKHEQEALVRKKCMALVMSGKATKGLARDIFLEATRLISATKN